MSAKPDAPAAPVWPASLPPMPVMDFTQFGEVETVALPRHQSKRRSSPVLIPFL